MTQYQVAIRNPQSAINVFTNNPIQIVSSIHTDKTADLKNQISEWKKHSSTQNMTNQKTDSQLQELIKLCETYKKHLEGLSNPDNISTKKLDIVKAMLAKLNNPQIDSHLRIKGMMQVLTDKNKAMLKNPQEPKGKDFVVHVLKIAASVLTLGAYSKATKDTFQFWKSQEKVFDEKMQKQKEKFEATGSGTKKSI